METKKMKNLTSEKVGKQVSVRVGSSKYYVLPFFKCEVDFRNENQKKKFISCVERLVRQSPTYRSYIRYLKEEMGLTRCMMFGEIDDTMAAIEMHHGPIFTLYDYVEITIIYFAKNNLQISTFSIADQVLQDHCQHLIQIVMLSEMAHNAVHAKDGNFVIVDINSAWGNLKEYLEKYKDCLTVRHYSKIRKYFDKLKELDNDSEIFKQRVQNWKSLIQEKF